MSQIIQDIQPILTCLQQGGIAAIPTETVYGLAGNATDTQAIQQIYALKQRPLDHPLIMHISKEDDIRHYAIDIPDYVYPLIQQFWPGPLTLVLRCDLTKINPLVTAGQNTIAIRCPQHPLAQQLLQHLPFPLVAPSANPFGKVSPTSAQHVQESFPSADLLILEGGRCPVGIESTIILATDAKGYRILRHGNIDSTQLSAALPHHELASQMIEAPRVSGNLLTHYQPTKPLYYFTHVADAIAFCAQKPNTYVISSYPLSTFATNQGIILPEDPKLWAYELYDQLRLADHSTAQTILITLPPEEPAWQGTRERILKAGTTLLK